MCFLHFNKVKICWWNFCKNPSPVVDDYYVNCKLVTNKRDLINLPRSKLLGGKSKLLLSRRQRTSIDFIILLFCHSMRMFARLDKGVEERVLMIEGCWLKT